MYGLLPVDFGLGNRYSLPGVSSIWRRKASRASAVIGMSPIPLAVFESAICTTAFSRSTCVFFMERSSFLYRSPISRKDHHDVQQEVRSREFDLRLLARRHVVRLASRFRHRQLPRDR